MSDPKASLLGQKRPRSIAYSPLQASSASAKNSRKRTATASASRAKPTVVDESNPATFVAQLLAQRGMHVQAARDQRYFLRPTPEMIDSYDKDILAVVKAQDIGELRKRLARGQTLQCCNRFGESLIHMACRNGMTDMVRFLVLEANVSLFVRDDYGRTPAHDACWTVEPNFELVDFLLQQAPQLFVLTDVRGHTPFAYARWNHWKQWMDFLQKRKDLLLGHTTTMAIVG